MTNYNIGANLEVLQRERGDFSTQVKKGVYYYFIIDGLFFYIISIRTIKI